MDSTITSRDLGLGALTEAESQAVVKYDSCIQAVVHVLCERGHRVVVTAVKTPELATEMGRPRAATTPGLWTAIICDTANGYVARADGPSINRDPAWETEPLHISRHNTVEQFLRYLRRARPKSLQEHLDADSAYRELFADEYYAICAAVVEYWWLARMAEGHAFESAQTLLALTLPTHLQRLITYERGMPTLS